jgi:hypothetical protein
MLSGTPPRLLVAAIGLVTVAQLATVVARLGRPAAGDVARSFDTVEGLTLLSDKPIEGSVDPCRVSAIVQAERPGSVHNREYGVDSAEFAVVFVTVYDFGSAGRARPAFGEAIRSLTRCRGFRTVARNGLAFRFEYTGVTPSDVGNEAYAVELTGRTDPASAVVTEQLGYLFRRGRFVVNLGWWSAGRFDASAVRCLAELADATARGAGSRRCSTSGTTTT